MKPLNQIKAIQLTPGRRHVRVTRPDGTTQSLRFRKVGNDQYATNGEVGVYLTQEFASAQVDVISRLPGGGMLLDIFTPSGWLSETRRSGRGGMTVTYANGDDTVKSISRQSNRRGAGTLHVGSDGSEQLHRYLPGGVEMTYEAAADDGRRSLMLSETAGGDLVHLRSNDGRISWQLVLGGVGLRDRIEWDEEAAPATPTEIAARVAASLATAPRPSATMQAQLRRLSKVAERLGASDPLRIVMTEVTRQLAGNAE